MAPKNLGALPTRRQAGEARKPQLGYGHPRASGGGIIAQHEEPVPPLIRRYIKTSFVFLVAGLLLGGWIIVGEFVLDAYPPRLLVTAHVHLLLVGFMLMIVMGVATWMFPRPAREDPRYRPELAETVYWVMTLATATRGAAEILAPLAGGPGVRLVIALAGIGQIAGTLLFVVNMWWRVRMPPAAAPKG
jgi:hypothetical protein